jgi:metal-responsive CopG/Arc/MetJ family transcriptional regulator
MKPIQVLFDEALLAELDANPKVRKLGRSAILRQAAADYLRRQRRSDIASQYQRAYGNNPGLGTEFEGWEKEGWWPEE